MDEKIKDLDVVFILKDVGYSDHEKEKCVTSDYILFENFIRSCSEYINVKIYVGGVYYKGISHKGELNWQDILFLVNKWLDEKINK